MSDTIVTNRRQAYNYTLKTCAWAFSPDVFSNPIMETNEAWMQVHPPRDALTIENIWVHIVLQFDSSIASGNRKVEQIGIQSTGDKNSSGRKYFQINKSADAGGKLELRMDLSTLLKPENIARFDWTEDPAENGTYVFLKMPAALDGANNCDILLWKIDTLYTTKGIR